MGTFLSKPILAPQVSWPVHIGEPWEEGSEGILGNVWFLRSALGCLDALSCVLHHVVSLLHPQFHCSYLGAGRAGSVSAGSDRS